MSNKPKVLMVGPSTVGAKGGISQFINSIQSLDDYEVCEYQSFKDGNILYRLVYMAIRLITFMFVVNQYDIIHIHQAADLQALRKCVYIRIQKLAGKKVVLHMHGSRFIAFYSESSKFIKMYITNQLNKADVVIALQDIWKQQLENIAGVKNCKVVYNGIDLRNYEDCAEHPENIEYKNYGLFLGRLGKRKGTYDLIKAANRLTDIKTVRCQTFKIKLAGDGEETNKIKSLANSNQEFLGWISGDTKLKLLKQCKFFVLPQYNEGVPIQIIEAMAAGKAIISTNVGGIPDVVSEENGFIIEPGDIERLKECMIKLIENDELCRQMGLKSLEYSKKYQIKKCKQDIIEIYKQI